MKVPISHTHIESELNSEIIFKKGEQIEKHSRLTSGITNIHYLPSANMGII